MKRIAIPIHDLAVSIYDLWSEHWILLTAGDFAAGKFNAMAIGWGGLGNMWGKPFVHVVVRPTRYTHEFMERYDTFTVCVFPEKYAKAVQLLGTKSGRDSDKIAASGLTPIASKKIKAPGFDEAELILECRQIYRDHVDPRGFLDKKIDKHYPLKDYHGIFYGEVLAVSGARSFLGRPCS
jgi:flavin reductase (DIM6/NTAB) family NADH-FMN oxidoreductase RutF